MLSAESHVNADTVVATVNGTDITLGHMIVLKQRLPAQYQQLAPDVLFDGILDQLVQQTLLGQEVDEPFPRLATNTGQRERALCAQPKKSSVSRTLSTTDEALQAAYDAAYGDTGPETEYNASHILVETEDEAKALVDRT